MTKLQICLALICFAHVCFSASIESPVKTVSNALDAKSDSSSSEELTAADVDKFKQELLTKMDEKEAEAITGIFRKFTNGTTDEEKFEGVIQLLALGFAASQNKTGTDILKLFDSSEEQKETDKPTKLK